MLEMKTSILVNCRMLNKPHVLPRTFFMTNWRAKGIRIVRVVAA